MKIICIIICLLIHHSITYNIVCEFKYDWYFPIIGKIYYCSVQNHIIGENHKPVQITSVTGNHTGNITNFDVLGFTAVYRRVERFPHGLEKIFENLKLIYIENANMTEIDAEDLRPFSKLECLSLDGNKIQMIDSGIFYFNKKLKHIQLTNNRIIRIAINAFDDLKELSTLELNSNECIDMKFDERFQDMVEVFEHIEHDCHNPEYLKLYEELIQMQEDRDKKGFEENFEQFDDILKNYEMQLNNSKWANYSKFVDKVREFKNKTEKIKLVDALHEFETIDDEEESSSWKFYVILILSISLTILIVLIFKYFRTMRYN